MSDVICKLPNGNFLLWSLFTDAPSTYGVALPGLEEYLRREEGERYMRETHPDRMRIVEMHGTSLRSPMPKSFEQLIKTNRAGPNDEPLTMDEILEQFGQLPQDYVEEPSAPFNPNRCETCIADKPANYLADTGVCGCCGQVADVWDPVLVSLYAGMDLSPGEVWCSLPRLRSSWMPSAPVWTAKGEAEIWRRIGEGALRALRARA